MRLEILGQIGPYLVLIGIKSIDGRIFFQTDGNFKECIRRKQKFPAAAASAAFVFSAMPIFSGIGTFFTRGSFPVYSFRMRAIVSSSGLAFPITSSQFS